MKKQIKYKWGGSPDYAADYEFAFFGREELLSEHIARIEKLSIQYNILNEYEWGYEINHCKKGNLSKKRAIYLINPITMLNTCQVCGKLGTPRKICTRNDVYGWDVKVWSYPFETKTMLCVGCWNKAARIQHEIKKQYEDIREAEAEIRDINRLTRHLKQEIEKVS